MRCLGFNHSLAAAVLKSAIRLDSEHLLDLTGDFFRNFFFSGIFADESVGGSLVVSDLE